MAAPDRVVRFLRTLEAELDLEDAERQRVMTEIAGHLDDDIARERVSGASSEVAIDRAIARLGPPEAIAHQYRRPRTIADSLVILAATVTALAAAWLIMVITLILPQRDPAGIPFWTTIAGGFVAYVGLTGFYLRPGRRSVVVRAIVVAASIMAIAVGVYGVVVEVSRATEFEGYVLLLGFILAGHGAAVLIRELASARIRRPSIG
jgi:HAAS